MELTEEQINQLVREAANQVVNEMVEEMLYGKPGAPSPVGLMGGSPIQSVMTVVRADGI